MTFFRFTLLLLLMLPLAACVTAKTESNCAENAFCAARSAEPKFLRTGSAERRSDTLLLAPSRGKKLEFIDKAQACRNGDADHCIQFVLLANEPRARAFVVGEFYYEGGGFLLIDNQTGRQTRLQGMPIFSQDGEEFFVAPYDLEHDAGPNNLEIWRRDSDGAALEWAHTFEQAHAEQPDLLAPYYVEDVRWEADRIALVLSEEGGGRNWKANLTRDAGGWHFQQDRHSGLK